MEELFYRLVRWFRGGYRNKVKGKRNRRKKGDGEMEKDEGREKMESRGRVETYRRRRKERDGSLTRNSILT